VTDNLSPCPFCGTAGRLTINKPSNLEVVRCSNVECGAEGPVRRSYASAAEAWNARATDPEAAATLERVERERDAMIAYSATPLESMIRWKEKATAAEAQVEALSRDYGELRETHDRKAAQVEALRKALETIRDMNGDSEAMQRLAQSALASSTPESDHTPTLRAALEKAEAALLRFCNGYVIESREDDVAAEQAIQSIRAALASSTPESSANGAGDRFWLVLIEPGCVPQRKGPWPVTETKAVLREFMRARPTAYVLCLTESHLGPDVEWGPELLQMLDGRSMSVGRDHNARTRAAHAEHHAAQAEARSASPWRDVATDPPKQGEPCLFWWPGAEFPFAAVATDGPVIWKPSGACYSLQRVKLWQPLPTPPKAEADQ
jgi:Lar family restriction alleviation protein